MDSNPSLLGLFPEEIASTCGFKQSFRGQQIFERLAGGVRSFDDITGLPQNERTRLSEHFALYTTRVSNELVDPDGTVKLAIELCDGNRVETVLLTDKMQRKTACLSCQVGCPLACKFCQTGRLGRGRNLTAGEIVEQFFLLESRVGKLDNIVFMGMGEPMLNFDAVEKAILVLTHPKGRNLSKRRITISTAGVCDGIYRLADSSIDARLALSLTTANTELRLDLMPITKKYSLDDLKKAVRYFNDKKKKRVSLELALMHKTNTAVEFAHEVIEFARGLDVHINLIPWNPVSYLPFEEPTQNEVRAFKAVLERAGLNVTIRRHRGKKIGGACGQLGKNLLKKAPPTQNTL